MDNGKTNNLNLKKLGLPSSFLFGAASAAHQVEGDNTNSDWWQAEQAGKVASSGKAADHYHRYAEDFKLAQSIGLNAQRISIEWSRIEPEEGMWDSKSIEHYRTVLQSMKEAGLTRMVTLFHFTLPHWVAERGGMASGFGVDRFVKFSKYIAEQLGDEIDLWVTINEPEVFALMSYVRGVWPPFSSNPWKAVRVVWNLIRAHNEAYTTIKTVLPQAQIGLAKNNVYYEAHRPKNVFDRLLIKIMRRYGNDYILKKTVAYSDFIGINYYFYHTLQFSWRHGVIKQNEAGPKSDMGWRTYPEGLYFLLKDLADYKKPIYITENGIANARDDMRQRFIYEHLESVARAVGEGIDVRGYFYWALTDTYEWHDGYGPKFGLIEVNFETQQRKVRQSAEIFEQTK